MTAEHAPSQPAYPRVTTRACPPPVRDVPEPPPFGWIGDFKHLTHDELDEIAKVTGKAMEDLEVTRLMAHAAVAYARRHDRDRYPWSVAGKLTLDELRDDEDQDQEEAEHAAAVEAAIEAGEPAPDPG
ncbi:hypothetical protein [Streptomyces alboflavus]|uniref:hypothetical protein n=1 Tax=Streptomyces alboflavus TaxID=67267 RepID=UPI003682AFD1